MERERERERERDIYIYKEYKYMYILRHLMILDLALSFKAFSKHRISLEPYDKTFPYCHHMTSPDASKLPKLQTKNSELRKNSAPSQ